MNFITLSTTIILIFLIFGFGSGLLDNASDIKESIDAFEETHQDYQKRIDYTETRLKEISESLRKHEEQIESIKNETIGPTVPSEDSGIERIAQGAIGILVLLVLIYCIKIVFRVCHHER